MVTNKSPKRGRGQPRKEPTQQVRIYSADAPKLKQHGKTQAEAIRKLLDTSKFTEAMKRYEAAVMPICEEALRKIPDAYKAEGDK